MKKITEDKRPTTKRMMSKMYGSQLVDREQAKIRGTPMDEIKRDSGKSTVRYAAGLGASRAVTPGGEEYSTTREMDSGPPVKKKGK